MLGNTTVSYQRFALQAACCALIAISAAQVHAIDIATAKALHVGTLSPVTLDNVRISNLYDQIDVSPFTLINVEDDTGGIAIFITDLTVAAKYANAKPGDVFDITAEVDTFFGLEEVLDGSLGAAAAVLTPKNMNVPPTVTSLPITAFPGFGQEVNPGTTPDDPNMERLESTQILFENVTIDQLRVYERDPNDNSIILPPMISVPDGSTITFPSVSADDDFKTIRLSDGVTPEADRPQVRIRSSAAAVIGQIIPNVPINVRALLYDVKRTDEIGEGRYRPYIQDVESTVLGDVDYDGDVDSSDYATASASFTQPAGITGSTAPTGIQFAGDPIAAISWDDGNIDRDFDIDNTDLLTIIGAVTSPAASGPAGDYTLSYDPSTGALTIDTDGGVLTGYSLLGDSFLVGSHTSLLSGTVTADLVQLSESEIASSVVGSQLSLGSVLPTGLTETQFNDFFSSATFTAEPGTGVNTFTLELASATGDYNNDGSVDGIDFLVWQRGESPNSLSQADLTLWESTYGTSTVSASATTVPEPTSLILILGCSLILGWRRF